MEAQADKSWDIMLRIARLSLVIVLPIPGVNSCISGNARSYLDSSEEGKGAAL